MSEPFTVALGTSHRATPAYLGRRTFIATGWAKLKVWDGLAGPPGGGIAAADAVQNVGLAAPAAGWAPTPTPGSGDMGAGTRIARYRYKNSVYGSVSDPSEEYAFTSTADSKYTFAIAASGAANILRSADFNADQIVLEMTAPAGADFYKVATVNMIATTIVADVSDAEIVNLFLPWDDDGHDPPPVKRFVIAHRGRLWLFGEVVHDQGTATVTMDSTTVTGSGTGWLESALAAGSGRYFAIPGQEGTVYEVATWVSETQITIRRVSNAYAAGYGAVSASGIDYQIVSRDLAIYFSKASFPESFDADDYIQLPSSGQPGQVMAVVGYGSDLLFFCEHSAYRFVYQVDPRTDGVFYPVPGARGALNQYLVACYEARMFAMDHDGFWLYAGGEPVDLSGPVTEELALLDYSLSDSWSLEFLPDQVALRWWATESGTDRPQYFFQLDLGKLVWSTGRKDQEVSAAACLPYQANAGDPSQMRPVLGDALGFTWYDDDGAVDGAPSGYLEATVGAGGSAQSVHTTTSLPTSLFGLRGVAATWVREPTARDETAIVESNTGNDLVLVTAFSGVPAVGALLRFGRVRGKLRSKLYLVPKAERGEQPKMRPRFARFYYRLAEALAGTPRYVRLRIYENGSTTAKSDWSESRTGDPAGHVKRPGSVTGYPASDWLVDVSEGPGIAEVPIGGSTVYAIQVELEVGEADTPLVLWGLDVAGVEGAPATVAS
jgi:hypothetical protein